jgi:hypothetical protein
MLDAPNSPVAEGDYKTFVIHMPVFEENFEFPELPLPAQPIEITLPSGEKITFGGGNDSFPVTSDMDLADIDAIELPSIGAGFGDFLEGFTFDTTNVKAYMYINGTGIVDEVAIEMDFGGGNVDEVTSIDPSPSGIISGQKEFAGTALPVGALDITERIKTVLNGNANLTVRPKVYLPTGNSITRNMIEESGSISVEIAIWFPVSLKAGNSGEAMINGVKTPGAKLAPEELSDAGSFITELAAGEFLEGIDVKLGIAGENLFNGAYILIEDTKSDYVIANQISLESLNFALSSQDIDYINRSNNFDPKLSIFFPENSTFGLKKSVEFGINSIELNAKIGTYIMGGEDK